MSNQLNITIDSAGLDQIRASGGSVVIANPSVPPGGQPIAWLAFQPYQSNIIAWEEAYAVYSSTSSLQPRMRIVPSTVSPAEPGHTYALQSNGTITSSPGGVPGGVVIVNETEQPMTVGLLVTATVNDQQFSSPASAAPLFPSDGGAFYPATLLTVFVESNVQNGSVLNGFRPGGARVQLTGKPVNLVYDSTSGSFEQR